jgi:hypothetical protein
MKNFEPQSPNDSNLGFVNKTEDGIEVSAFEIDKNSQSDDDKENEELPPSNSENEMRALIDEQKETEQKTSVKDIAFSFDKKIIQRTVKQLKSRAQPKKYKNQKTDKVKSCRRIFDIKKQIQKKVKAKAKPIRS